jgi:hypothetical protein
MVGGGGPTTLAQAGGQWCGSGGGGQHNRGPHGRWGPVQGSGRWAASREIGVGPAQRNLIFKI